MDNILNSYTYFGNVSITKEFQRITCHIHNHLSDKKNDRLKTITL